MDISNEGLATLGNVGVVISNGRQGHTAGDWAEAAVEQIIKIGDNSHPAVQAQARAFRGQIKNVIQMYIERAVRSEVNKLLSERG